MSFQPDLFEVGFFLLDSAFSGRRLPLLYRA
ncbi:hypothetical protein WDL1P1_00806 (plasmid) [Variovorax sp. WDL1]|nr:hypothetical protein WDL1P1_00806 [Variovorax sp. WDL1]